MGRRKIAFTDRWLRSLKPLKPDDPDYRKPVWDQGCLGLCVRIGTKSSFYAAKRRPGGKMEWSPKFGDYPQLTLADARSQARDFCAAITEGRPTPTFGSGGTFAEMAEQYKAQVLPTKRTAKACEQLIDREFIPVIGDHRLPALTQDDCIALLKGVAARSPHAARKALSELSVILAWAAFNRVCGLKANPASGIPVKELLRGLSYTKSRDRILFDSELRFVWQAAAEKRTPYPFGPLVRALILTGQRLNEIARARWSEIDEGTGCLVIPASRMKGKAVHAVPLTERMRELLDGLPRFGDDGYLFTTTGGRRPISGFSKMKSRLDGTIANLEHVDEWQIHDLRRTMRTGMSRAGVPVFDAELVIAHTQSGVHETYDRHRYQNEVLAALRRWEDLLFSKILVPPPDNVVDLSGREDRRSASA